jgi:hypothetical protein
MGWIGSVMGHHGISWANMGVNGSESIQQGLKRAISLVAEGSAGLSFGFSEVVLNRRNRDSNVNLTR